MVAPACDSELRRLEKEDHHKVQASQARTTWEDHVLKREGGGKRKKSFLLTQIWQGNKIKHKILSKLRRRI